ncbi:MAG: hypothetical protein ABSG89_12980 [Bacteroidales bacterium]|jgi:hypothetical protein
MRLKTLKLDQPKLIIKNVDDKGELPRLIKIEGFVLLNDMIAREIFSDNLANVLLMMEFEPTVNNVT